MGAGGQINFLCGGAEKEGGEPYLRTVCAVLTILENINNVLAYIVCLSFFLPPARRGIKKCHL